MSRVPPHSLEAETSILGAILLHAERFPDAREIVKASDFYRDAHRTVFEACERLLEANQAVDFLTISERLRQDGTLEQVGGQAYLASLVDGMVRSANIAHYAKIVHDKAQLRAAIRTATAIIEDAYNAGDDASDVIERAEQALFELSEGATTAKGPTRLSEIIPKVMDQIDRWCQAGDGVSGLSSGIPALDAQTRGFQSGNLIILAARPAMGKSSLALNIAQSVATAGHPVVVFSLEMSETELGVRALTTESGIDGHRLQRGRIRAHEWADIAKAAGTLNAMPLYLDDSPFVTAMDIRSRARRLKAQHGLALIVLDYTQLMVSHEKRDSRTLELGAISRMLKAIAKDLDVPLIALSQLSRKVEERADKRPVLSDLRESGALEQDADLVLFIHRPEVYNGGVNQSEQGAAELIIAKHRNGPIGSVSLRFDPARTKFTDGSF